MREGASGKKRQQVLQLEQMSCPAWPLLEPLVPREDLDLQHVHADQILTISNFWTSTLCKKYVAFLKNLPLTTTPSTPKRGEAVRVNDRFQVNDPAFAELLWSVTGLREILLDAVRSDKDATSTVDELSRKKWGGDVVGLNSNIRVYRYSKGQYFDKHCRSTFVSGRVSK